ncbi:MAG: DUF1643 domain-containing protein [Nostoc sp.]|uniref:DUF1643 domain-containing protein n=1 Tax=Nostoc sp. TaxID=1180 RepID=UPI002FFC9DD8
MEKYANIDVTRKYRYLLGRRWDANLPQVTFVMLNPSKADDNQDDPTLNKCIKFAHHWDYGSLEVVNLFAYITPKPRELRQVDDPVGSENNSYIKSATERANLIILAWGSSKYPKKNCDRDKEVLSLISDKKTLHCLKLTKKGYPNHPLYLKVEDSTKLIIFPNCSLQI